MTKLPGIYPLHQMVFANPPVHEMPVSRLPSIDVRAVIGTHSLVIGDVTVAADVFIGFNAVVRADSSAPFYLGPRCNVQDFALLHCHPGEHVTVEGRKYGIYLEEEVSVLHHAVLHGPLSVGRNTFIGLRVCANHAQIGRNCVIMHGAVVTGGVFVPDGRYVAPGQTVSTRAEAEALPPVPVGDRSLNAGAVDFYYRLGKSYKRNTPLAF